MTATATATTAPAETINVGDLINIGTRDERVFAKVIEATTYRQWDGKRAVSLVVESADGEVDEYALPIGHTLTVKREDPMTTTTAPTAPFVGQPATIHLGSDTVAAVVVKVNAKSIAVARVATGEPSRYDDGSGMPVVTAPGILDRVIGESERYSIVQTASGVRYGKGSIRVSLGRSVSITDYRV